MLARPLMAATALAVAATVVIGLAAALRSPGPAGPAAVTSPGSSASPVTPPPTGSTAPATRTPQPRPVGLGPGAGTLLTGNGSLVDLATATLRQIDATCWSVTPFRLPDGSIAAVCQQQTASADLATGVALSVETLDPSGAPTGSFAVGQHLGRNDPAVAGDPGVGAQVATSISPDGSTMFISWAERHPPVWHVGVDVVDLAARRVVQTVRLPDIQSSVGSTAESAWPQPVRVAPGGDRLMITTFDIIGSGSWTARRGVAPLRDGRIGTVASWQPRAPTCSNPTVELWATSSTYGLVCPDATGGDAFLRLDLGGQLLGSTAVGTSDGLDYWVADTSRSRLFRWSPTTLHLARIDLVTGDVASVTASPSAVRMPAEGVDGVLRALADWLVPTALAKMAVLPGLAIAPDGSRIYALGLNGTASQMTSTGVFVFDAAAMRLLAHWEPAADYVSIAVSSDGRLVYVAGASSELASGTSGGRGASLTLLDSATGAPRGSVEFGGHDYLVFPTNGPP